MSLLHRYYYRTHKALHFDKGYNFPLFVILVGALMGFVLARVQYLAIDSIFVKNAIPSDAVNYARPGVTRVGIIVHLGSVLPTGSLVCFQFVPIIRHKLLIFHRLNGYLVILLFFVSIAGVGMLFWDAAGGSPGTQVRLYIQYLTFPYFYPPLLKPSILTPLFAGWLRDSHRRNNHHHNSRVHQHQAPADRPAPGIHDPHLGLRRQHHLPSSHHDGHGHGHRPAISQPIPFCLLLWQDLRYVHSLWRSAKSQSCQSAISSLCCRSDVKEHLRGCKSEYSSWCWTGE